MDTPPLSLKHPALKVDMVTLEQFFQELRRIIPSQQEKYMCILLF